MIRIQNLCKTYGTTLVLDAINIHFDTGKIYGIIGENGAGKTTLFRCIAGLETYNGNISSDKQPLKNHLGFLMTEPFIFSKITGYEYINLLTTARQCTTDIAKNNIFDLPLHHYATTYSTGMKKKLALTAVLLQSNSYFTLDEPFSGVDIQSNAIITQLIHKLKSLGKTVLISSHIFTTLQDTCDEIFVLEKGKITKKVLKNDFVALGVELKDSAVGSALDDLDIN